MEKSGSSRRTSHPSRIRLAAPWSICGVKEHNREPLNIDGGVDPSIITREWIENVLNSTIQPRIDKLRIHPIPLDATPGGRVIYVIQVPQTQEGGPHQSADKRYYKRFNFQSVPMEDYEVRDVMRRALGPDLPTLNLQNVGINSTHQNYGTFELFRGTRNSSESVALYAHFEAFVDSRLDVTDWSRWNAPQQGFVGKVGQLATAFNQLACPSHAP